MEEQKDRFPVFLIKHFGQTQHFKNLIAFMLLLTLCYGFLKAMISPEKFVEIIMMVIVAYYVTKQPDEQRKRENENGTKG